MEKHEFKSKLILSDGSVYRGTAFGKKGESMVCELIFNTSMFGYQNVITDRSNFRKIIVFAYPGIGNYGVQKDDFDIYAPSAGGIVVRDYNNKPSSVYACGTLGDALERYDVPCLSGIDTRELVNKLRSANESIYAIIVPDEMPDDVALKKIAAAKKECSDLSAEASCRTKWYYRTPNSKFKTAVIDLGLNVGTILQLNRFGCDIVVFPWDTTAAEIIDFAPDNVVISNGPGVTEELAKVIKTVKVLLGKTPVFGIGLGMDVIAAAEEIGLKKLAVAHRGTNHAVRNTADNVNIIVNQNHTYCPERESLEASGFETTFTDVVSGDVEGFKNSAKKTYGTEFYPDDKIISDFLAEAER